MHFLKSSQCSALLSHQSATAKYVLQQFVQEPVVGGPAPSKCLQASAFDKPQQCCCLNSYIVLLRAPCDSILWPAANLPKLHTLQLAGCSSVPSADWLCSGTCVESEGRYVVNIISTLNMMSLAKEIMTKIRQSQINNMRS